MRQLKLVLPADKGGATVVMARDEYLNKMNAMLADDKTYQPIEKDPTPPLERKMNALLLQLKKKDAINQSLYNRLRSSSGSTPCCMASLRFISLACHCVQLSPL